MFSKVLTRFDNFWQDLICFEKVWQDLIISDKILEKSFIQLDIILKDNKGKIFQNWVLRRGGNGGEKNRL